MKYTRKEIVATYFKLWLNLPEGTEENHERPVTIAVQRYGIKENEMKDTCSTTQRRDNKFTTKFIRKI